MFEDNLSINKNNALRIKDNDIRDHAALIERNLEAMKVYLDINITKIRRIVTNEDVMQVD